MLRPLILIPAWGFYLIGAAQGRGATMPVMAGLPSPVALLALTSILICAYLLNQIFDRETDERNDKCFYLSRGIFRVRTLVIMSAVFFVVAAYAFQEVAGPIQRWALLLALALSLLYSLPPIRLCARPFLDMLANAVGYGGGAFAIGFGAYQSSGAEAIMNTIPYVLLVESTFLHTTILDVEGDKASDKISTTVLIGERRSANLAAFFHLLAILAAFATANFIALIITGLTLPAAIYALKTRTRPASATLIQVNTLVVAAVAVFLWPVFGAILVPLVLLARFYYRRR
ncbi:MAG: UbiA family prenyltransferase, partial [Candidatus Krumholzibacteria bacterium]|nr:UbiA family prenyltransferase [Candidatus Krumholzibacteria bacterium]